MFPVYIGDDRSDEDAFKVSKDLIWIFFLLNLFEVLLKNVHHENKSSIKILSIMEANCF